jgi:hypothetical protein
MGMLTSEVTISTWARVLALLSAMASISQG